MAKMGRESKPAIEAGVQYLWMLPGIGLGGRSHERTCVALLRLDVRTFKTQRLRVAVLRKKSKIKYAIAMSQCYICPRAAPHGFLRTTAVPTLTSFDEPGTQAAIWPRVGTAQARLSKCPATTPQRSTASIVVAANNNPSNHSEHGEPPERPGGSPVLLRGRPKTHPSPCL